MVFGASLISWHNAGIPVQGIFVSSKIEQFLPAARRNSASVLAKTLLLNYGAGNIRMQRQCSLYYELILDNDASSLYTHYSS